mmetsp:Transcript_8357/g.12338  ORF Transcript_8357/g.12338 Transcript_8357/m.12338 type:complete len:146 (-) Transcript_8357:1316-1753(-)
MTVGRGALGNFWLNAVKSHGPMSEHMMCCQWVMAPGAVRAPAPRVFADLGERGRVVTDPQVAKGALIEEVVLQTCLEYALIFPYLRNTSTWDVCLQQRTIGSVHACILQYDVLSVLTIASANPVIEGPGAVKRLPETLGNWSLLY